MPFPLAHPAAVLPLRRFCPRWLSFPALLLGSVSPDAGYCFGKWNDILSSHQFLGSLVYCLPLSLLGLWVFYRARWPLVRRLPSPYREALEPHCQGWSASWLVLVVSILLGAWTHLLLDDVTHKDGWIVGQVEWLKTPVLTLGYQTVRGCHLLWYGCTFAGVFYLVLAVLKWWSETFHGPRVGTAGARAAAALVFAGLVLPVAVFHHMVHSRLEIVAVGFLTLSVGLGFMWFLKESAPPPPRGPEAPRWSG